MTTKNDGGPAFPIPNMALFGLSIRDHFAGLALQGMVASPELMQFVTSRAEGGEGVPFERLARQAYRQADAMLKERSR